ncbi:MAG: sigma factor-like helix-turn-helix DNA-binding protein [Bacillota bacterium]|nr:sigma factor-like helix-turn-helix DNA-binding protein [Bacillota bacterium]
MQVEIRGLERLSFRERQVVVLKESGRSNQEVAARLGLSPSTVATLYHRARTKGYNVVVVLPGEILGLGEDDTEGELK